jgi:hypothetical protein
MARETHLAETVSTELERIFGPAARCAPAGRRTALAPAARSAAMARPTVGYGGLACAVALTLSAGLMLRGGDGFARGEDTARRAAVATPSSIEIGLRQRL